MQKKEKRKKEWENGKMEKKKRGKKKRKKGKKEKRGGETGHQQLFTHIYSVTPHTHHAPN